MDLLRSDLQTAVTLNTEPRAVATGCCSLNERQRLYSEVESSIRSLPRPCEKSVEWGRTPTWSQLNTVPRAKRPDAGTQPPF